MPGVAEEVAERVCDAVARLRGVELYKLPGVGETIAWAQALIALGGPNGDLDDTLGVALKVREDLERVRGAGGARGCLTPAPRCPPRRGGRAAPCWSASRRSRR